MASPPTLRSKLLRWLLVPLFFVLVADIAGSTFIVRRMTDRIYDGELAEIARELALHVRADGGRAAFELSPEAERTLLLDEFDRVYYVVRDASGRAIGGEAALPFDAPPGADLQFVNAAFDGRPVRIAALRHRSASSPEVTIEVAETEVKRHRLANELLLGLALPQIALIVLAGLLVWWAVAHELAPLERLRNAVAARSHTDMSVIEQSGAPGEVQPLVTAINELMQRLGAVLDFQGRVIADTAHQLRTPVAGLKAHIEVALREQSLAKVQEALAHLYTSAERLSRLVSQLLSLARNEPNSARRLNFTVLDVNKLTLEITKEWVAEAYKKEIDLGYEGAGAPVLVYGDPARLTELVNNLVDNAIRYTAHGGRVTVQVRGTGRPQLVVSDDGPRIPVEERERVFERFHRLLGNHAEGSGLGLAIGREIAKLHEAEIGLEEDVDGIGNTFTVTFPDASGRPGTAVAGLQAGNPAAS